MSFENVKLTIDDFRFSKIKLFYKSPNVNHEQLLVKITKTDPVYKHLSSAYHRAYINHNIPEIPNSAPTLDQYWNELKVYRNELRQIDKTPLRKRPPKQTFFEEANLNFTIADNARRRKYKGLSPVYYYHYNVEKKKAEHISIRNAKKFYCKMYEKDIMGNEDSRRVFKILLAQCKTRNKKFHVIIRGFGVVDNMDSPTDLKQIYKDDKLDFGCEYCLVEMLIHYPNLNECMWNQN